jgi:hypothetical protein
MESILERWRDVARYEELMAKLIRGFAALPSTADLKAQARLRY